jgi:hypothetical protein
MSRPCKIIDAPAAASTRALSAPMPELEPVTNAQRPFNDNVISIPPYLLISNGIFILRWKIVELREKIWPKKYRNR